MIGRLCSQQVGMSESVVTHKYNLQSKNYKLNGWKPTTQI